MTLLDKSMVIFWRFDALDSPAVDLVGVDRLPHDPHALRDMRGRNHRVSVDCRL